MNWSKNCPRISPSTGCCMSPKKKIHQIQVNNNLGKKWLKTNIPQSVELNYPRTVASFFGIHHSVYVVPLKAPLGFTHVQES